ncbi:MAG: response regulator [Candidatus Pacebacteria bacterium]|nr:response regulator [Candidatus Paceibacterota bacterium]
MKSILLVEDDPLIVEIYTRKLKQAGFKVQSVSDGEKTISVLKQGKFDLLVLDIVLPNLTGFEILQRIRRNEKLKNTKILVLSNLGQKTDIEKAEKFQVARYLIKAHYTPSEVIKEIEKLLK